MTYVANILPTCYNLGRINGAAGGHIVCLSVLISVSQKEVTLAQVHQVRQVRRVVHQVRRVHRLLYTHYVHGSAGCFEPASMRIHAQVAVSSLQLLLIAVRGHRAYTRSELHTIFVEVGTQFFTSLESLTRRADESRMQRGQQAHDRNPHRNRPPVPFKRQRR